MNTTTLKRIVLAFAPASMLALTGCWTPPTQLASPSGNPSLAGAWAIVETAQYTATVNSVDASQRKVVLRRPDGTTSACKFGPDVVNFNQIQAGDKVKVKVADELAIFLVKNGPLPSAGTGVLVAGAPTGSMPAGLVVETTDSTARVIGVDRSYRLLTLEYADGKTKTVKVPLPNTLEHVNKGDDVVVRATERMVLEVKPG
jgi:hypothetical protein